MVIVHPPGGIAGGDQVHISVALESASKALITTPGATRWYKTNGRPATQGIELRIAVDAQLEWLPQETILFDAADATSEVTVELAPRSVYIGCDVLCLGRAAAGERLTRGRYRQRMSLRREGRPIWMERGMFEPARSARHAAVAFADATVAGTVIAAAPEITPGTLESVRSVLATQWGSKAAASRLPGGLLVARYLGDSSEQARRFVLATWSILRPALMECPAIVPRLWNV